MEIYCFECTDNGKSSLETQRTNKTKKYKFHKNKIIFKHFEIETKIIFGSAQDRDHDSYESLNKCNRFHTLSQY